MPQRERRQSHTERRERRERNRARETGQSEHERNHPLKTAMYSKSGTLINCAGVPCITAVGRIKALRDEIRWPVLREGALSPLHVDARSVNVHEKTVDAARATDCRCWRQSRPACTVSLSRSKFPGRVSAGPVRNYYKLLLAESLGSSHLGRRGIHLLCRSHGRLGVLHRDSLHRDSLHRDHHDRLSAHGHLHVLELRGSQSLLRHGFLCNTSTLG